MHRPSFYLFVAGWLALNIASAAENPLPFVSPMFGHNMILQRAKTNTIWGWTKPGDEVRVQVGGRSASAKAAADGRWQAQIQPPAVGGPYTLTIEGAEKISFTNILVGDVWLCGGQSNMEWPLERARHGAEEVKAANHPNIRLFTVKQQPAYSARKLVQGSWRVCSPQSVKEDGGVSAVGYFFARKIQSETNVPIGLIKDCWGGTPAESWTSIESIKTFKEFEAGLKEIDRLHGKGGTEHGNYIAHWYEEFDRGQKENWFSASLNDDSWETVSLPDGFRELGVPEGPSVCYFRKTISLPNPLPSGTAKISLGIIERMDTVMMNDRWVGASSWVENPRSYDLADGVLKPGTNVIVVRVLKTKADGGFKSKPEGLKLVLGDKTEIPLAADWKGKLSVDAKPPHSLPIGYENWPTMPAVLYNGMIAPVAPLGICGAIWYQGESNVGRAEQYRRLLSAMIGDWRNAFQQGEFPFYIVSLAAFQPRKDSPGDDSWAELREAQAWVARNVPNSGLAITTDVGDANDIHPVDKKEVGERLAFCALANHYGKKMTFRGPTLADVEKLPGAMKLKYGNSVAERSPGALKLKFADADGGLVVKGEKLGEFSVAGEDRKWAWADAKIDGAAVVVSSADVPNPVYVRYAWQANPLATLFNGAGLPAEPFRTDK